MNRKLLLTVVCMAISAVASQMTYAKESPITPDGTYLYAERDTCDLYLDVYNPAKGSQTSIDGKKKPTIVFMFGGGFIGGTRDDASYNQWFRTLTQNGYRVISIDYRLGLKGSDKVGVAQVNVLDKAIHMAVEDLFSATVFMIDNAEALGIDPENIVVSGSSAGAISVMQAEYEICNSTSWTEVLPEGFNYAGVMSFSGAILSRKGKVKYAKEPCPTLMLHGTADKLVPYKQIAFFNLGFFGGGKLVERFKKFGLDYNMYHFIGYGHEIAGSMSTTTDLQFKFLECNVMEDKDRIVETWIEDPNVYKGSGPQSRKELYGK
ncbi:MAG: carboxylesterase family protein [Bacteroidales bacterium]|nr:carboxylesterase family protein [Bacteroidales bacterium]